MRTNYIKPILISCICLAIFIFGEIIIRNFGHYDNDGNFFFYSRKLKPYKIPIGTIKENIDISLSSPDTCLIYDSELGWAPKPNTKTINGLYDLNTDGIRTVSVDRSIPRIPDKGVLRIAIFGDSFTFGYEVPYENTWGYYLENYLKSHGMEAQVLNFGVGGYGFDQAFLRWKKLGYKFSPHIVIFGFQPENVKRNNNLISTLYFQDAVLPFSKPRYILEKDKLRLINSSTPDPKEIINIMENIDSWDLIKYDYWYKNYQERICFKSKLVSSISYVIDSVYGLLTQDRYFYDLNKEPAIVSLKIIRLFKDDVESNGAKFYVVHLPTKFGLKMLLHGKKLYYADFMDKLEDIGRFIHTEDAIAGEARKSTLYKVCPRHYSAPTNKIVADIISKLILKDNPPSGNKKAQ